MIAPKKNSTKQLGVMAFVSTFHTPKNSVWAENDEKCLQKCITHIFFDVYGSQTKILERRTIRR
jgi:hypothetical protein